MYRPLLCPQCGGEYNDVQGRAVLVCRFCSTETRFELSSIESYQRMFEKRAELQPAMNALMERYSEHLGAGEPDKALVYFEAFTYLLVSISYEVDDLGELEVLVVPIMQDAAEQLGTTYLPPAERGEQVTNETVSALVAA